MWKQITLPSGHRLEGKTWNDDEGQTITTIRAYPSLQERKYPGEQIGSAEFYHHPEGHLVSHSDTWVDDNHQRRGVGSAMYQLASEMTGKSIEPSSNRTQAGTMFWQKNGQKFGSGLTRILGKSERSKDPVEVASVAIFNSEGELLFGRRNDDDKWELAGGHLLPHESPEGAARRESKEETGLDVNELQRLGEGRSGVHLIHSYKAISDGKPTAENDPDGEFKEFCHINVKNGLPEEIANNLHSPKNITLRLLGLQEETEKAEKTVLETLVKNLALSSVSEWKGDDTNLHAIVMPDIYRPGSLTVRWFDEHGFLGQSPSTPRLSDIAKSITEQFRKAEPDAGALDRFAEHWDILPPIDLSKSTEVGRLIEHPDPAERSMALKLSSVQGEDLARALASDDPVLQRTALNHPQMDSQLLMLLMRLKDKQDIQHEALSRDDIESKHLSALLDTLLSGSPNHGVLKAIAGHPQLDRDVYRKMWDSPTCESCRRILIRHPVAPPDILQEVVESALASPEMSPVYSLASDALQHRAIPPGLLVAALKSNQANLRLAASKNPDLPQDIITDILSTGSIPKDIDPDAEVRANVLKGYNVQRSHLDTALQDVHPDVRAAVFESPSPDLSSDHVDKAISMADMDLIEKAVQSRVAGPEHKEAWLTMLGTFDPFGKSEELKKAIDPDHFKGIKRALDVAGRDMVDHTAELQAHPDSIQPFVDNYNKSVLNTPLKVKPHKAASQEARESGVTRKLVYGTPTGNGPLFGEPLDTKYMVKPYHERIIQRTAPYMKHPHQGWSEMTNQALYHAGGIGHLHQKVHVAEHNMGPGFENEPALIVKMDHGFKPVSDLRGVQNFNEQTKGDARKIALMDFLSNNQDRHYGNLMVNDQGQLLAIDHPRSFQYIRTRKDRHDKIASQDTDTFGPYHLDSAINKIDRRGQDSYSGPGYIKSYEDRMAMMEDYRPTFEWWAQNRDKIKSAMAQRLKMIKDPKVRIHIEDNFNARAAHLDQIADFGIENFGDDWYKQGAPMTLYGEDTNNEENYRRQMRQKQDRYTRW